MPGLLRFGAELKETINLGSFWEVVLENTSFPADGQNDMQAFSARLTAKELRHLDIGKYAP